MSFFSSYSTESEAEIRAKERKKEQEDFLYRSEMCDCCCHNSLNIRRAVFYKEGVRYVIRYCENCNPQLYFNSLFI